jgi:hypothetical protein
MDGWGGSERLWGCCILRLAERLDGCDGEVLRGSEGIVFRGSQSL